MFPGKYVQYIIHISLCILVLSSCQSTEDVIIKRLREIKRKAHIRVEDLKCYASKKEVFTPVVLNPDDYIRKIDAAILVIDSLDNPSSSFELAIHLNQTIPEMNYIFSVFSTISDKQTTGRIYGLSQRDKNYVEYVLHRAKSASQKIDLEKVIYESLKDSQQVNGKVAIILMSYWDRLTSSIIQMLNRFQHHHKDKLCIYTIGLKTRKNCPKIMNEKGCGFSICETSVATGFGMADFVKQVFLKQVSHPIDIAIPDHQLTVPTPVLSVNDSDSDGVPDHHDRCPGTPMNLLVNDEGCWLPDMIFFQRDRSDLQPEAYPTLDQLVNMLRRNPSLSLEIHGHTCNTHTSQYNEALSINRAESARKYLIQKGISPDRIVIKGLSQAKPIYPNTSEDNRSKNRRVEFLLKRGAH